MPAKQTTVLQTTPIDFQWPTLEPFLFCVHHFDHYPKGQPNFGPDPKLLRDRSIGMDFTLKDGFRMYHGSTIPGFPAHPHRGFETITIVRRGYVDHADSLGASGRYGEGDVQWMTAGRGIQHSEMFPLLNQDKENTLELFQIWLNLPKKNKMVAPHFKMFWSKQIPTIVQDSGKVSTKLIAGNLADKTALSPPPDSWASDPNSDTLILLVSMRPDGIIEIPRSCPEAGRMLYFFNGDGISVNDQIVKGKNAMSIDPSSDLKIKCGKLDGEFLFLQSRAIGEPIAQRGPFVMNTDQELMQAFADFRKTEFGGWPWQRSDQIHGPGLKKFAKYPDGRQETE